MSNDTINGVKWNSRSKGASRLVLLMIADQTYKHYDGREYYQPDANNKHANLGDLAELCNCTLRPLQRAIYGEKGKGGLVQLGELVVEERPGKVSRYFIPILEGELGYDPQDCHEQHLCNGYHTPIDRGREAIYKAERDRRRAEQKQAKGGADPRQYRRTTPANIDTPQQDGPPPILTPPPISPHTPANIDTPPPPISPHTPANIDTPIYHGDHLQPVETIAHAREDSLSPQIDQEGDPERDPNIMQLQTWCRTVGKRVYAPILAERGYWAYSDALKCWRQWRAALRMQEAQSHNSPLEGAVVAANIRAAAG